MRALCTLVLVCASANAADIKLHSVDRASDGTLYVQFETPAPPADTVQCPSAAQCGDRWAVVVYDVNNTPASAAVTKAEDPIGHFPARGLLVLTLDNPLSANFSRVEVTFKKAVNAHATLGPKAKPKKNLIKPSDTCTQADVCISGSVVPSVGSGPSYNIDSKAKYVFREFGKNGSNTLSATADIKTDNRTTADPDSFHWGIPVQHVSRKPYTCQWSLVGMDFDKKGQAMNVVSAPNCTWITGHSFVRLDDKKDVVGVLASVGLDLTLGAEFGDNLRNDFAVVNKNDKGEGGFFRGVPSANVYLVIPQVLKLNKISVSSSYTVRIPTRDELFLETRNTKNPIPKLTSGTRHYLENNIQFMFTEYLGFQIKHKFGELPPAFKFANHSVSVGLVFAFAENKIR